MVDRTGRDDDRVHVVPAEQLVVGASGDAELGADLLRAPFPGRRDRHQPRPRKRPGVARMHHPHAAESGHAEADLGSA